jgi:hypothetical protein
MCSEDNTSSGSALPPGFVEIPAPDVALIRVLLARFDPSLTRPWVWLTSPAAATGPRTIYHFAHNPATQAGERGGGGDQVPPDCPPFAWAAWGLLYPNQSAAPFGPYVGIPEPSAFHGTVCCLYQRLDIVPGAVRAEYCAGVEGGADAYTQTRFILPYEASIDQIREAEDARAWLHRWAPLQADNYERLCREIEAKYWKMSPPGRRATLQKTVAQSLGVDPRHLRRAWTLRRGKWPPRAQT